MKFIMTGSIEPEILLEMVMSTHHLFHITHLSRLTSCL